MPLTPAAVSTNNFSKRSFPLSLRAPYNGVSTFLTPPLITCRIVNTVKKKEGYSEEQGFSWFKLYGSLWALAQSDLILHKELKGLPPPNKVNPPATRFTHLGHTPPEDVTTSRN